MTKKQSAKRSHYREPPKFWGVRVSTWFGIGKWIGYTGGAIAAIITALVTAYKMIWG
jgi:hypothetical protein